MEGGVVLGDDRGVEPDDPLEHIVEQAGEEVAVDALEGGAEPAFEQDGGEALEYAEGATPEPREWLNPFVEGYGGDPAAEEPQQVH